MTDYHSLGITIRRSGKAYAVYLVFLDEAGKTIHEELVADHRALPSAAALAANEFRVIQLKLNRHEYELPVYVQGLEVG